MLVLRKNACCSRWCWSLIAIFDLTVLCTSIIGFAWCNLEAKSYELLFFRNILSQWFAYCMGVVPFYGKIMHKQTQNKPIRWCIHPFIPHLMKVFCLQDFFMIWMSATILWATWDNVGTIMLLSLIQIWWQKIYIFPSKTLNLSKRGNICKIK